MAQEILSCAVNLRTERLRRGYTLEDLAAELETSASTISNVENGRHCPRPRLRKRIADFYDCDVTDIWPAGGKW